MTGASPLEADYLVVGAGATAMAFVDTLLDESPDATVLMVDRHHRPGGHWNDAYPFVRLHQPSAFYGVASRELSSWTKDRSGLNAGLYGLASGAEVLSHFEQVLNDRFLPSGRVRFCAMSEHATDADGTHRITSLTSGEVRTVRVRRKLVDATHAQTAVPATHPPKYAVDADVHCVPPNRLPDIRRPHAAYTVVGAGKTGIDACLWLLANGVPPQRVRWVVPRDAWWLDRANSQPGADDFERTMGSTIGQFEAIAQAASVPDLFHRLESRGLLLRLDPAVEPTLYRCAIVSQAELAQLRCITDVVRLGRVQALEPTRIVLEHGNVPADPDTLYVDCSASAIVPPPKLPVFDGDRIHLLMVRWCQPVFSAALIAWVESHLDDAAAMNALCRVVPSPEQPADWLRMWAVTLANTAAWRGNAALGAWLTQCRLNSLTASMRGVEPTDTAKMALLKASGEAAAAAATQLPALLAQLGRAPVTP
jgi:hypothetical protein